MIITDKSISEFINKSLLTDKIENSELKNQNSSIRAIGRTTPNTRNHHSTIHDTLQRRTYEDQDKLPSSYAQYEHPLIHSQNPLEHPRSLYWFLFS